MRRVKAALIGSGNRRAAQVLLGVNRDGDETIFSFMLDQKLERKIREMLDGKVEAALSIDELLKRAGVNAGNMTAASFVTHIDTLATLEHLQASIDGRRNTLLREIERRRFAFSQRLRAASQLAVTDLDPRMVVS